MYKIEPRLYYRSSDKYEYFGPYYILDSDMEHAKVLAKEQALKDIGSRLLFDTITVQVMDATA